MKTRHQLEQYVDYARDTYDQRKKVSYAVFSYLDEQGTEYRKRFTSVPYTPEIDFWKIAPLFI